MVASGVAAHVRQELNNDFVKGNDYYPRDITATRAYLANFKGSNSTNSTERRPTSNPDTDSSLFIQKGDGKPAHTERDLSHITCRHPKCGQVGHLMNSSQCPECHKEAAKVIEYNKWKAKQDAKKKQTQKKGTPTKESG